MIGIILGIGALLFSFGGLLMLMNITPASWEEMKDSFRETFHNFWFRVGAACVVVGLLMMLPFFSMLW